MKAIGLRLLAAMMSGCLLCGALTVAADAGSSAAPAQAFYTVLPSEAEQEVLQNGGMLCSLTPPTLSSGANRSSGANLSQTAVRKDNVLPAQLDLRQTGGVTAVDDQLIEGPCWSFAAAASMESTQLPYDGSTVYSQRFMSYFAYAQPEQYNSLKLLMGGETDIYKWGGFSLTAVSGMANWIGPANEFDFPYGTFDDINPSLSGVSELHLQQANFLPVIDRTAADATSRQHDLIGRAKKLMLDNNCALTAMYYSDDPENDYDPATFAWYNDTVETADHGVAIVGWDDAFPRTAFPHSDSVLHDGAWLVKNSWGADFGDNGYFWLSYEDLSLVLGGYYEFEPTDNYDHLYSYDTFLFPSAIALNLQKKAHIANTFTAERDEELEAVSFYTSDVDAAYTVEIYRGLSETTDDPTDGELCATLCGTESYWGYHTVSLEQAIPLHEGERFSVVVLLENPSNLYTTYMEIGLTDDPASLTLCAARESYVDNEELGWMDCSGMVRDAGDGLSMVIGNFPIKAFTGDSAHVVFSREAGTVPYGTEISLDAVGGEEILYTTDGSDPRTDGTVYTQPLCIDRDMTVKAAVRGSDRVTEKRYTQTAAQLISLLYKDDETIGYAELTGQSSRILVRSQEITICPIAGGRITIDGEEVVGGSEKTLRLNRVNGGYALAVTLTVTRDGCQTGVYHLLFVRAGLMIPTDLNGNGVTDIDDVAAVFSHVAGEVCLSDNAQMLADVNRNGEVDIRDVLFLYYYIAGILSL